MHSASCSLKRIAIAIERALLTTLRCVSVAPFGLPVVPLVNWMLIGSVDASVAPSASSAVASTASRPRAITSAKRNMPAGATSPIDTTMRRLGTRAACRSPGVAVASSGARVCSISTYADVLKRSAAIIALQPTLFSAYSSSASR
ncbi:hypothetical protein FEQ02_03182 [Burkholderia pseudomultivorans]|nr:hypothetical protein [Burkholderia pseudomultivorans]MDR8869919.1 hypothetical protein [Burkholderia pseudomultivorans]